VEEFFNVNDLMVRNPVNARWEEIKARAAEVKADLGRDPKPTIPPPFVPFGPDPSGVFGSGGWQGDFDPNAWAGVAETFEDADGRAQKERDQQAKRDRRALDKLKKHENIVENAMYHDVDIQGKWWDRDALYEEFAKGQKGIRTKGRIRKKMEQFAEADAAEAARNLKIIHEESNWPFQQIRKGDIDPPAIKPRRKPTTLNPFNQNTRRMLPETTEDLEEQEPILPKAEQIAVPRTTISPRLPAPQKQGSGGGSGVALLVGLIVVTYLFADSM